jgi:Zn-dependent M28 family amino/carboxypeptidase
MSGSQELKSRTGVLRRVLLKLPALGAAAGLLLGAQALFAEEFSGNSAFTFTRKAVDFGPRPPGTPANTALQNYIIGQLKGWGLQVIEDPFTPTTPKGPIAMKNILAKLPGTSGRAIAVTGHFDTKLFPGRKFVGASDGGSSTGALLELARVMAKEKRTDDVYIVFLDGEEAIREQWAGEDNLYGSRHLADKWKKDGTIAKLKAVINLDMIGDKFLNIRQETNGNARLNKLFWQTAADLGYRGFFIDEQIATEDDHLPFIKAGAPAIDIIDFDYPPWHEDSDTMDKLSAKSLEVVGGVTLEVVHRLEGQK